MILKLSLTKFYLILARCFVVRSRKSRLLVDHQVYKICLLLCTTKSLSKFRVNQDMFGHTPLDRIDRLLKEVVALKPDDPASPTVLEALRCIMQTCNADATLANSTSTTSPRSHASTASNTSGKSKASSPNGPPKPQRYVMTRSPTLYNKTLYI